MKLSNAISPLLLSCVLVAGCAPVPRPVPGPPLAADNGQPRMQACLGALQRARGSLESAAPNKGGHREQAIRLIQQAMDAVNAGMQYAASHPTEIGVAEGPAAPEPVNEAVPGAERQPHMAQAIVDLREARRQLREAKPDKGGFRVQGLEFIQQAIAQVREGIQFANRR